MRHALAFGALGLAVAGCGSSPAAPVVTVPATVTFPKPPTNAVVFAREDGKNALALGVVPRGKRVLAQVSVVGQQGTGISGLAVRIGGAHAAPCGAGCYRATIARPATVRVVAGRTRWNVALPKPWPPRDADALLNRAETAWRRLRALEWTNRLASDPGHVVTSRWKVVAPDRLAYHVDNSDTDAVLIGNERWDRTSSGPWQKSSAVPIHQPAPFWDTHTDSHVLGASTFHGKRVWDVSFFDADGNAWFQVAIERSTMRTLDLHMTTTAHFMRNVYGPFDAPVKIAPPR